MCIFNENLSPKNFFPLLHQFPLNITVKILRLYLDLFQNLLPESKFKTTYGEQCYRLARLNSLKKGSREFSFLSIVCAFFRKEFLFLSILDFSADMLYFSLFFFSSILSAPKFLPFLRSDYFWIFDRITL
jgi:hypothetical protein